MSLMTDERRHSNGTLAVETRGLAKRFGPVEVLRGVDLEIPRAATTVVLGPSGTGKSVLLSLILGLQKPDRGEVLVQGESLATMRRKDVEEVRRHIGVMFQDGALFSSMNVFDNVAFPLRQHTDMPEREIGRIVEAELAAVGLGVAAGRMPNELSGGMKKRAGLARALSLRPDILLCDEPDSGLDPVRTALLGTLLQERRAEFDNTMIVVTHNIALARLLADHVALLWQGRVVAEGPAEETFASDDEFTRQFLSGETVGPLTMD